MYRITIVELPPTKERAMGPEEPRTILDRAYGDTGTKRYEQLVEVLDLPSLIVHINKPAHVPNFREIPNWSSIIPSVTCENVPTAGVPQFAIVPETVQR